MVEYYTIRSLAGTLNKTDGESHESESASRKTIYIANGMVNYFLTNTNPSFDFRDLLSIPLVVGIYNCNNM